MLIEIHMIQNHSPANLNRDDLGAPKTCIFGGVTRARISSQCLKRSIRRSEQFAAALERDGGVRTRRLVEEIAKAAADGGQPQVTHKNAVAEVFKNGGVTFKSDDGDVFASLWFLPRSAINELGEAAKANSDLGEAFASIIAKYVGENAVHVPDIALCGRMTEFEAKGPFKSLKGKFTVDAALSDVAYVVPGSGDGVARKFISHTDLPVGLATGRLVHGKPDFERAVLVGGETVNPPPPQVLGIVVGAKDVCQASLKVTKPWSYIRDQAV